MNRTLPCPECGVLPISKTHPAGLEGHETRHHLVFCKACFPKACHSTIFARGVTLDDAVRDWNEQCQKTN